MGLVSKANDVAEGTEGVEENSNSDNVLSNINIEDSADEGPVRCRYYDDVICIRYYLFSSVSKCSSCICVRLNNIADNASLCFTPLFI